MTKLYIGYEFCESIEQLKRYFNRISSDPDIYNAILDYGKDGDIASWLKEKGEDELSAKVEAIDRKIGDSEYMNHLTKLLDVPIVTHKPAFSDCVRLNVIVDDRSDERILLTLSFTIISSINESYYVNVETEWGNNSIVFNPSSHKVGECESHQIEFAKKEQEFGQIRIIIDGEVLYSWNPMRIEFQAKGKALTMVHIPDSPGFYVSEEAIPFKNLLALLPSSIKAIIKENINSTVKYLAYVDYHLTSSIILNFLPYVLQLRPFKKCFNVPTEEQYYKLSEYSQRIKWANNHKLNSARKLEVARNGSLLEASHGTHKETEDIYRDQEVTVRSTYLDNYENMNNISFRLCCYENELIYSIEQLLEPSADCQDDSSPKASQEKAATERLGDLLKVFSFTNDDK